MIAVIEAVCRELYRSWRAHEIAYRSGNRQALEEANIRCSIASNHWRRTIGLYYLIAPIRVTEDDYVAECLSRL